MTNPFDLHQINKIEVNILSNPLILKVEDPSSPFLQDFVISVDEALHSDVIVKIYYINLKTPVRLDFSTRLDFDEWMIHFNIDYESEKIVWYRDWNKLKDYSEDLNY